MKKNIVTAILALVSSLAHGQTLSSYADVFPTNESRLGVIGQSRDVEDTAVNSVDRVSFASKLEFPIGTTLVNLASVTFTLTKRINGVNSTHLSGISMALSKFNDETAGNGTPNIFGRTSTGVLIAPTTWNLVGNDVAIKTLFITDHGIPLGVSFPKMIAIGDYYRMSRSLSGNYTANGIITPFSVTGESTVFIANETDFPVNGISTDYPNNPKVVTAGISGGTFTITTTGLTVASYQKTWWVETSTNLVTWTPATGGIVSPAVTVTFPVIPGDPKRFWRINGLQ